jgi:hypothetical protein
MADSRDFEREACLIWFTFGKMGGLDVAVVPGTVTPYPSLGCSYLRFNNGMAQSRVCNWLCRTWQAIVSSRSH